jgi:peptide/nickel transport system permease protein
MPPFIRFLLRRLLAIPITLLIVTAVLYAFIMITPPQDRASMYLPSRIDRMTAAQIQRLTNEIIANHHLAEPFPIQYGYWIGSLLRGEWGYSPLMQADVLDSIRARSPVTIELTLWTLLFILPTGIISGLRASEHRDAWQDHLFRFSSFTVSSIPPFVLGLMLMGVFYVTLQWFPPERLSTTYSAIFKSTEFHAYTGMATVDGLLNGRLDLTLDALRHLVLPVISLGALHWATLGRVARISALEEYPKEYILAAKAHGLPRRSRVWKHVLRNILSPSLTSTALTAASLFTGVIVIERTFNFKGISELAVSLSAIPDTSAVMGFSVYSVLVVLGMMLVMDLIQVIFDPRVQMGLIHE